MSAIRLALIEVESGIRPDEETAGVSMVAIRTSSGPLQGSPDEAGCG
ncbi:hypothetical protein [Microtetraspora malaysiensis]